MARPEAAFRTKFKTLIRKFHPISVENLLTTPGLPDVAITTGWIELKILPKWPAREATPLRIEHFTDVQRAWAKSWTAAGGNYWLVVKVDGEIFIFDATSVDKVGHLNRKEMKEEAIAHFPKWPTSEAICPFFELG